MIIAKRLVEAALGIALLATTAAWGGSIESDLARSHAPRDWMLAAQAMLIGGDPDASDALARKAAEAAPGDVLVQWLAAMSPVRRDAGPSSAAELERARRLAGLEPDNSAHWLVLLALQNKSRDAAGIDETLARMAAAAHFDEHYRDYVLAWAEAYERFPPAERVLGTEVVARMAAVPLPPYTAVVKACDPAGQDLGWNESRRETCEAAARAMIDGRTVIAQHAGYAILRRMKTRSPDDEAGWLAAQWVGFKAAEIAAPDEMLDPAFGRRLLEEWRDIGREDLMLRRRLEQANIPTTPPPGWQPKGQAYAGK